MIKIGVLFGGKSREREISFAGGRTVYDALNKSLFEAIPIFIDGVGNMIELNWGYIYKGTIRDFYPPAAFYPESDTDFQLYTESLGDIAYKTELLESIGKPIQPSELKNKIDLAFLALHGPYGEDGSIQGLLDFYEIPYTGSGIYPSAIGISKAIQKEQMRQGGFRVNDFITFSRGEFDRDPEGVYDKVRHLKFPLVIKASSQGSSIGVHFLEKEDPTEFKKIVSESLFRKQIKLDDWQGKSELEKLQLIRDLVDLQHGLGLPLLLNDEEILLPSVLRARFDELAGQEVALESVYAEPEIVVEEKLRGKEFSCIVIRDSEGNAIALPPTEIRKSQDLFDYRSKYLPGITRKVTPIEISDDKIASIREACSELFDYFRFDVYARIDGFITAEGEVYLNDPNTTSGMLPSSFFFHQAAEIGLSPNQFLSYIVHQSLHECVKRSFKPSRTKQLLTELDDAIIRLQQEEKQLKRVGVIFGGYSSERHISVESGRNVFEKLSSTTEYHCIPIFLTKENEQIRLFQVPISLLLKDNADDIADKLKQFKISPLIGEIIKEGKNVNDQFTDPGYDFYPREIALDDLHKEIDFAFLALHGRPGEDGTLQQDLLKQNIPFNGSGPESSSLTIDKYETNELLSKNGISVAKHRMVYKDEWLNDKDNLFATLKEEYDYPFIAKPADDGCSSAVKKIDNEEELDNFCSAMFRTEESVSLELCEALGLKPNEEFPSKQGFLIEELIEPKGASHFLEITGGMFAQTQEDGSVVYQAFEASEAVAEAGILSLEDKFLAGEGQNITPARYARKPDDNKRISSAVKEQLEEVARLVGVEGYCRIDAFVRIFSPENVEVIVIEINSLPGLTPATAIFHQAALAGYKPAAFLSRLIKLGIERNRIKN